MTAEQGRKTRAVLRVLDAELDSLLISIKYGEPTSDGKNPARELERLVGTAEAKLFIEDEMAALAKLRKTTIRALVAQRQERGHGKR
jgi:hypothetical protein